MSFSAPSVNRLCVPFFFVISLFTIFPSIVIAATSMEKIIKEQQITQCKPQLLALAEEVIGEKPHRLHVDQPKGNQDLHPLTVVGVISYNDQDAHIQFNASPLKNGGCEVSYEEAFVLFESCIEVREQVFKKWKFIGRLSEDTFFLKHKKRLTKNATLTAVKQGTQCLVTRRNSGI